MLEPKGMPDGGGRQMFGTLVATEYSKQFVKPTFIMLIVGQSEPMLRYTKANLPITHSTLDVVRPV